MNQKWKTLIVSVLTPSSIISGIALIVLWGYFSRLDRLDIFFDVMNIKSILVLVCCTTILSLIMIIFIFFITSFFIPIVIPYDIKNLPAYNKIQGNFLSVMMLSGLFPMAFIYVLYCAFDFDQSVKDNSGWLSILSIGVLIVVISAIINTRYLEYDLSFKNNRMKLLRRVQIYLIIPLSIALLVHLQVIPLEMVFRNIETEEKADKYLPVDMYIGGVEHAVLHLLYSRFYTKFLYDIGAIDFDEPFQKLFNQGMITGKNGIKMSKSKGNVVSPDDLVRDYGCDSLRLYELFVGPPELDAEWDDRGIDGVYRFLNRFWKLSMDSLEAGIAETKEMVKLRHKLVFEITQRLESFSLNTVISGFMEYNNKLIELAKKTGGIDKETIETFIKLLAPFAPHLTEELWEAYGHEDSVFHTEWPEADEEAMKDDEIEVPVQINGKTRAVISISAEASKEEAIAAGKEAIADKLTGTIVKEIYVPKKIINIVQK